VVRLAALLHDVGKPATFADGHFRRHDEVGARIAEALLTRLRYPRAVVARIGVLVRHHMVAYDPGWSDAAVRRFIRRVGRPAVDELFALCAADDVGSGHAPRPHLAELHERVRAELEAEVALDVGDLAVDGSDLMAVLGIPAGPTVGRILDELLERVIAEPADNDRPTLLLLARTIAGDAR
jgi:hypothetical protein